MDEHTPTSTVGGVSDAPSSTPKFMMGCGAAFLTLMLIGSITLAVGWSAFVRFGVSGDLDDFARDLQDNPHVTAVEKKDWVLRIDDARSRVKDDDVNVPFFEWIDIDKRMTRLTTSSLDELEREQLEREVKRIERLTRK